MTVPGKEDMKNSLYAFLSAQGGKKMKKGKIINLVVEILLYSVMVLQMLYALLGNIPHEILGVGFFIMLACHIVMKRWWFKSLFRNLSHKKPERIVADVTIVLLLLTFVLLSLSGIGVSRFLFPKVVFLRNPELHSTLATIALALSVLHGGSVMYIRSKRKKLTVLLTLLFTAAALLLGFALVPYMDRHFKKVSVDYEEVVSGSRLSLDDKSDTVIVYFTRVGNTAFEENVDAVSGASLMLASGKLMGNAEILADMLHDITGYPEEAITLTGNQYPSSYSDTVSVGGRELREQARPAIKPIDVADCDTVILVYPLWWGTIPMPVAAFLEEADFTGKTIYLVATQGSSGFGSSRKDTEELARGARVEEALSIYCDDIPKSRELLYNWISDLEKE